MIIVNGYIRCVKESTEENDENGYAVVTDKEVSDKRIPCQYLLNSDLLAESKEGNPYSRKTATIYIELQAFEAERIQLFTKNDKMIGEYSVRSITELKAVRQVQIVV